MAEKKHNRSNQQWTHWRSVKYFLTYYVYSIHGPRLKRIAGDEKLMQDVFQQVNLNLALYHSYQFVAEWPDQGSVCKEKKLWLPTCAVPRRKHKSSDTWSRKKAQASPLEPVPSLRSFQEQLGLQPNLGHVGGSERTERPACKKAFSLVFSADVELKSG